MALNRYQPKRSKVKMSCYLKKVGSSTFDWEMEKLYNQFMRIEDLGVSGGSWTKPLTGTQVRIFTVVRVCECVKFFPHSFELSPSEGHSVVVFRVFRVFFGGNGRLFGMIWSAPTRWHHDSYYHRRMIFTTTSGAGDANLLRYCLLIIVFNVLFGRGHAHPPETKTTR